MAAPYSFVRGLDFGSIVETSEKVAWAVDEVFAGRRFDASKKIVPDSWTRTQDLAFLNARDDRTLNHARAFSYAHLFGNYEEFIPLHLTRAAQDGWHGDRARLGALLRFGEEEMKHQQLFLRTEAVLEESCGHSFGRYFDQDKVRVTELTARIMEYDPLARSLMLIALEWGGQRHYIDSVRDRRGDRGDGLYVDVLKAHWIEENQHVKTGALEIADLAQGLDPDQLVEAFESVRGIAALVDRTFVGQVDEEIATLERVRGRSLGEAERKVLHDVLYRSMQSIWVEVGLAHPDFETLARELSGEGASRIGIS